MNGPFSKRSEEPEIVEIESAVPAPYIRIVNEFLADFIRSSEERIEFSAEDIVAGNSLPPLLSTLQGSDYERIRLRLRAISNLNPVINPECEEGTIQCTMDGREFKFRSIFAPNGKAIALGKVAE